ncbi:nicotinate (nicotinamide) nucleotide adenylyltransferase [Planctomycetota bacterium]
MNSEKIILFGGTFDPIHLGHIIVASAAFENIDADRIIFIPAKLSPLKESFPTASNEDRLNMIKLAISEYNKFEISDYELKRPAPSYTLDTVRYFRTVFGGNTEIFCLIGADNIDELIYWHGIIELIDECNLCTMYRAGCETPDFKKFESKWGAERVKILQNNIVKTPLVEISSTQIRRFIASKGTFSDTLHPAVADYIEEHRLYK